jgi:hypothetical protein
MDATHRLRHDDAGMVGKIIVIWLVMVAVLGVIALDAASVVFATFRASDTAATAATAGAAIFRTRRDVSDACDAARRTIATEDPDAQIPKSFCKVDTDAGRVTITVKKQARTIIAGRLSFTEDLTKVVAKETAGPSTL